jgi:hypothetical protein
MKQFLFKLLVGALPFVMAFALIEHHCRTRTVIAIRKDYVLRHTERIQVLLTGDSHSNRNLNPGMLTVPAASVALGGQPMSIDYYLLQQLLPTLPHLSTVVIEVSPHRFYYDLEANQWNAHLYRAIWGIPYQTEQFSWKNYSLVLANHRHCTEVYLNYLGLSGKYLPPDSLGFVPSDSCGRFHNLAYNEAKIAATFSMRHKFDDTSLVPVNLHFLNESIGMCRQRGVRVVLVSAPLYPTYTAAVPQWQWQRVNDAIRRLADSNHVPWYNYSNDPRFTVYHFHDDDHLNPRGAALFTAIVNNYILSKQDSTTTSPVP